MAMKPVPVGHALEVGRQLDDDTEVLLYGAGHHIAAAVYYQLLGHLYPFTVFHVIVTFKSLKKRGKQIRKK